jgi:dGTPase
MFDHVYLGEASRQEQRRVAAVIERLLDHYLEHPAELPPAAGDAGDMTTRVTDYLAGMTDRFCIRDFERLTVPRDFS